MDDLNYKRRTRLICLGLAVAVLAAYFPLWHCGFVEFDDPDYVTSNPMVKHKGVSWAGIVWAFSTFNFGNWHPLTLGFPIASIFNSTAIRIPPGII